MADNLNHISDDVAGLAISTYSKSQRYMAFLMQSLPLLSKRAIFPRHVAKYRRSAVLERTLEHVVNANGLSLEFGVYKGDSINLTAKRFPGRHIYGFDSFEGFPEDGRKDWQQDFAVEALPQVRPNVTLIKGWFSDTLQPFLSETPTHVDFLNVDCDIYSSTKDVFDALSSTNRLVPGTVIFFDELVNYTNYLWNEMLALFELLEATGLGFRWVAVHQRVRPIADTIHMLKAGTHPTWQEDLTSGYRQQASIILTDEGIDYGDLLSNPATQKAASSLAKAFDELQPLPNTP